MQRGLVAARGYVAVNRVVAEVGGAADEPFGERRVGEIADLREGRLPIDQLRLFRPKSVTFVDGSIEMFRVRVHRVPPQFPEVREQAHCARRTLT